MKTPRISRVSRIAAMLAATTFLIAADAALARGNGGHNQGSDNNQLKSRDFRDHGTKQPSLREVRKDMNKRELRSKNHQDRDAMRAQRKAEKEAMHALRKAEHDARRAAKTTDQDKMNAGTGTTTATKSNAPAATAKEDLFGKGIVGRPITDSKQTPGSTAKSSSPAADAKQTPGSAAGTVTGLGAANTVRPIPSPPPSTVTISNGVSSVQIKDGAGGVTVSSSRAGTITVSNGTESQTLAGGALTISGAKGIGGGQNIQVGAANGEGRTVVAIKPPTTTVPVDTSKAPPGVTVGDDAVFVGKSLAAAEIAVGATAVGVAAAPGAFAYGLAKGHPIKTTKEFIKGYYTGVKNWIGSVF
jgi:hypothetical protein